MLTKYIIPVICCVIILGFAAWFGTIIKKVFIARKALDDATSNDNPLESLNDIELAQLAISYRETIVVETPNGKHTNIPSNNFFTDTNVAKAYGVNLRFLDAGSGTLVGLGLFGTFLGLTVGINGFHTSSSTEIQDGIQNLLDGMGTAFLTSLVGMCTSIIFTLVDKYHRNKFAQSLLEFTEKVDEKYFIDDNNLMAMFHSQLMQGLYSQVDTLVKNEMASAINQITSKITYKSADGETITIGDTIRDIHSENKEQSRALKSFSTDLAIELSQGFDEVMSKQMQEKILPLMKNVDETTRVIVEHIDTMASQVASPATDMIEQIVSELQRSMASIIEEFKTNLSGSATNELENLAIQLGSATQAMAEFPRNMENISATLQVTIEEVKNAISEISNTSANANSTAMQQMQEQITFATGAISNAISEVKDVMSGLTHSSQEQSNQMVSKLADAADKMGAFLNGTITSLSASVQNSIKGITDDVNSKQADLIALQEDATTTTKKLLEQFNTSLERLEQMNEYVKGTMDMFQQAQGHITGSTAHLQTITGDMKLATQLFNKSNTDYTSKMEELLRNSQRSIDSVTKLISNAADTSDNYVNQFETIKMGLGTIFAQLKTSLIEYSRTVQATTQSYLDKYSTSLTDTTNALQSTIHQQSEVVEMLVESLDKHKKS